MPGIFYRPVDRGRFLVVTTRALAGAALVRKWTLNGDDKLAKDRPVRFALLSDTHIPADPKNEYRGFFPWQNLKKVVPQVIDARPDGVILDGDAARLTGEIADYETVGQLLAPLAEQTPIYIGLGNHDDRDNFFKAVENPAGTRQKVSGRH